MGKDELLRPSDLKTRARGLRGSQGLGAQKALGFKPWVHRKWKVLASGAKPRSKQTLNPFNGTDLCKLSRMVREQHVNKSHTKGPSASIMELRQKVCKGASGWEVPSVP